MVGLREAHSFIDSDIYFISVSLLNFLFVLKGVLSNISFQYNIQKYKLSINIILEPQNTHFLSNPE